MAVRIEHDAAGKVNGVVYVDGDGKMQSRKPASSRSPAIRWKARACF